jgi:hypothetical protein
MGVQASGQAIAEIRAASRYDLATGGTDGSDAAL